MKSYDARKKALIARMESNIGILAQAHIVEHKNAAGDVVGYQVEAPNELEQALKDLFIQMLKYYERNMVAIDNGKPYSQEDATGTERKALR